MLCPAIACRRAGPCSWQPRSAWGPSSGQCTSIELITSPPGMTARPSGRASPPPPPPCRPSSIRRSQEAFVSDERFLPFSLGWDLSPDILELMSLHGALCIQESSFGEMEVALEPAFVDQETVVYARFPVPLVHIPPHNGLELAPKMALLLHLVRDGWSASRGVQEPHWRDGPRELSLEMVQRSRQYFLALANAEQVFRKGCPCIRHGMPEAYYLCLLNMKSLSGIEDIENIEGKGHSYFAALLDGKPLPQVMTGLAMAIEDGDPVEHEADSPAVLTDEAAQLAFRQPVNVAAADMIGAALAGVDAMQHFNRPVRLPGCDIDVRYDFFSHTSGVRRAYARCLAHRACFRYRQVNQFDSEAELLGYLFAWASEGPNVERAVHVSRDFHPPPAAVRSFQRRLSERVADRR